MADWVNLQLTIAPWLRDSLREVADREGVSISQLVSAVMYQALAADELGMPVPPPVTQVPTVGDVLKAYVDGESKLIGPCGEPWPCEYDADQVDRLGDAEFCHHCHIRTQ